jgi:hypothetical protein
MEHEVKNLLEDFIRWAETAPPQEIIANLEATDFREFLDSDNFFEDSTTVDIRTIEFFARAANTYSYAMAA